MHLYSYRGVQYTVAPKVALQRLNDIDETYSEQDIFTSISQTRPPVAVVPMVYRGALYLLERFSTIKATVGDAVDESTISPVDASTNE